MSKGLFNWSSYTEKKESEIASPKKGEDTIPKPKYKKQEVRVIRFYLKRRSGYIVAKLEEDTSAEEKILYIINQPDAGLIILDGIYVDSDRPEILRRENMSDFYVPNSSVDFLAEGKGWLIEDTKKEGDD